MDTKLLFECTQRISLELFWLQTKGEPITLNSINVYKFLPKPGTRNLQMFNSKSSAYHVDSDYLIESPGKDKDYPVVVIGAGGNSNNGHRLKVIAIDIKSTPAAMVLLTAKDEYLRFEGYREFPINK